MGIASAIIGGVGGLCAAMGVVTITGVITPPPLGEQYTWTFWFALAAILLLGSIALVIGRSSYE
jgi:hypothetical protein